MGFRFTKLEIDKVHELYLKGFSDAEIARELNRTNNSAVKAIYKLRKRNGWHKNATNNRGEPTGIRDLEKTMNMEDMTRPQRIAYLRSRFESSPRCRETFKLLSADELEIFQDEYFRLLSEIDNVSAAEEQSLFLAIFEFVLAFQAQRNKSNEEQKVRETQDKKLKSTDANYRVNVNERWNKEYTDHMKVYRELIAGLKLSREQRLKDEIKSKKTFLDYAYALADRENQLSVAREIVDLDKKSDEELKRLIENGWLFGDISK